MSRSSRAVRAEWFAHLPALDPAADGEPAALREHAALAGDYWKSLIASGIPPDVAETMLVDWSESRLSMVLGLTIIDDDEEVA